MKAEYQGNKGFLQRDSVEHKGYAEAQSTDRSEGKERDGASDLLEAILDRDNLNKAYKRVRRNHGAAGIDGMTVEEAKRVLKAKAGLSDTTITYLYNYRWGDDLLLKLAAAMEGKG